MTKKEMDALKESAKKCNKNLKKIIEEEISCREMIMSCLIYGSGKSFYDEENDELGDYALSYWVDYPKHYSGCIFTKEDLVEMFNQQKEEFAKGECGFAGYDSEGVSYNYFKYADEILVSEN